jgi:cytochrome c oxidase subunit 4
MTDMETSREPGMKVYVGIWLGLIAIVAVEVFLTYQHLPVRTLLFALLALALAEATIGVAYFMHMRYERRALVWSLFPYLVFVFLMMNHLWPDSMRLISLRMMTK